jgi:hypothetical protein
LKNKTTISLQRLPFEAIPLASFARKIAHAVIGFVLCQWFKLNCQSGEQARGLLSGFFDEKGLFCFLGLFETRNRLTKTNNHETSKHLYPENQVAFYPCFHRLCWPSTLFVGS